MWKEHFKNLLGNSLRPIIQINNTQLDIKLAQYTQDVLNVVQTKNKSRKVTCLEKNAPRSMEIMKIC